ncbi:Peroxide stress-activated histidine kinase mak1 [Tolypocladium capitatum]|uniref:histidine kinase n=1 Tax=Tolypocladium capitatum TaxID=45235 RepID=A0A2K3QC61_9HYPO|nr:Peroxide stress-activated histidine kinase mak1 [Tolypocladium capitatum]
MAQRRSSYHSSPVDPPGRLLPERLAGGASANANAVDAADDGLPLTATAGNAKGDTAAAPDPAPPAASRTATSQKHLNEYREKLACDLEIRELSARGLLMTHPDKVRVSPIPEEAASDSPLLTAALTSSSTESGNTARGGMTPGPVAGTPSYPFPRMPGGGFAAAQPHKSLPSPAAGLRMPHLAGFEYRGMLDKVLSENSTPASNYTFKPSGPSPQTENFDFPTPNLYDLSLMLSAEPGLDAWWNTVVQIMRDVYQAERVTLAIPADTTDIENVPWGQKATYSEHHDDDRSMGYMARGSSAVPSSEHAISDIPANAGDAAEPSTPTRPDLASRHSFTTYEDNKQRSRENTPSTARRPPHLTRSKTHLPSARWEAPFMARYEGQGRVLPVLQALDYEADPLIDHTGVMRVLQRGRPVALTRSYPYLPTTTSQLADQPAEQKSGSKTSSSDPSKRPKKQRSESISKLSSIFAGQVRGKATAGEMATTIASRLDDEEPRPPTPKYEEYEQAPPSPWSQSPAPSPAVRADPKENPFFTDAMVDEDSFNPGSAPANYNGMRPPEAIGIDNSWTVLHMPLTHVLLSRPTHPFKLDSTAMEQRSQSRSKDDAGEDRKEPPESDRLTPDHLRRDKPAPIAILSILSPIIPYPSNLRRSLDHLAPHMATSFSICRHYTNLETELAGMQRKRPQTAGFGAVAPFARHIESVPYLAPGEGAQQPSLGGSITSPGDYSGVSKSAAGSPIGTPGWEQGSLNYLVDKRQPTGSPAAIAQGAESYFSSKQRPASARQEAWGTGTQRPRAGSKDNSPGEKRHSLLLAPRPSALDLLSPEPLTDRPTHDADDATVKARKDLAVENTQEASVDGPGEAAATKSAERHPEPAKADPGPGPRQGHTVLHSYGADFAATFQSLPPSSSLARPLPTPSAPPRASSLTTLGADMPPPSDRLKGLILDSLPAHVFVSLPQTGETVWVNSRFLSYRGQTVADLSADPWASIHPDDRNGYLKAWGHSLRTGEQFSRTVRIKRFDGAYRWFYARAVASKDKRGVIMQFLGSYMDIHDQHIAELRAARQEEVEASEAKHRLLANLIPQIIFTATEDEGVTFANEQWLSYTGQSFDASLNLGFMDYVHPDDLAKCRIPTDKASRPKANVQRRRNDGSESSEATPTSGTVRASRSPTTREPVSQSGRSVPSRSSSSGTDSGRGLPSADLMELARKGIIKVATDTSGRLSYTTEVRLRSKTGEYRWHLIRCVEIDTIDFGRGASSYFGSATDINDHKILETKLKEAMESKSRFLSNMSHEIRTPLIGISGMVSFLQDTTLDEEQRDYTNTIQTSANSLIMIINDILDLSKVDAGMMKLKYEWFHTRSLIEDVNELVSTMAIAKRLELNYLVDAEVPPWVKGDKVRIRQVLLNVIGNAIKFTTEGEVFSRCRVYAKDFPDQYEHEITLQFAITDTGQGFSKEEADLIFKPFSQIDGSSTRQHGGSGLGLVISRQLVELHGGKMEGTAELGKGSTFTFTARFALPTLEDHPNLQFGPPSTISAGYQHDTPESVPQALDAGGANHGAFNADYTSPGVTSTGSSDPSVHSSRSHLADGSSVASVNTGLARFSEAAKASGQDLSQMRLEMPLDGGGSPGGTATPDNNSQPSPDSLPPLFSILIICSQYHSREATAQHIEMTLPKEVPHRITALATVEEAQALIGGDDPTIFTHIVLNLASAEAIIDVMDQVTKPQKVDRTTILILSDSVQRQAVMKQVTNTKYERLLTDNLVTFIYKPVKPSRFAVIFDPDKVRDLSTDRNRSTAEQMVENQKASYQEIKRRMGNRGYKVLLVEDNPVNQKVLTKYLNKIGVDVDVAVDGVECTEKVLSKPHKQYSLILCDLHMPRKDGYQACREIRQWERAGDFSKMPIIALSANVMSDVQEKCIAAGFSDYVTKPVDFIDLSRAMAKFF